MQTIEINTTQATSPITDLADAFEASLGAACTSNTGGLRNGDVWVIAVPEHWGGRDGISTPIALLEEAGKWVGIRGFYESLDEVSGDADVLMFDALDGRLDASTWLRIIDFCKGTETACVLLCRRTVSKGEPHRAQVWDISCPDIPNSADVVLLGFDDIDRRKKVLVAKNKRGPAGSVLAAL